MTTTTQTLVDAVVALLSTPTGSPAVYPTLAGPRVYAPRDWPTWDGLTYPVILVRPQRESKESLGRNQPQFNTTSTVRISARTDATGAADDASAGVVETALWLMQRQIEVCLVNATADTLPIEQFARVETDINLNADGEKQAGELLMDFDLEFYQGADDFYPVTGPALEELAVATPLPTQATTPVGADIDLPQ